MRRTTRTRRAALAAVTGGLAVVLSLTALAEAAHAGPDLEPPRLASVANS